MSEVKQQCITSHSSTFNSTSSYLSLLFSVILCATPLEVCWVDGGRTNKLWTSCLASSLSMASLLGFSDSMASLGERRTSIGTEFQPKHSNHITWTSTHLYTTGFSVVLSYEVVLSHFFCLSVNTPSPVEFTFTTSNPWSLACCAIFSFTCWACKAVGAH